MKRIAILQSNYIPWKGYFDLINSVDEFIIFDDAQYTRRDWRNRNLIKTKDGIKWLTIPVKVKNKFFQSIKETKVESRKWYKTHLKTIINSYSKSGFYNETIGWLSQTYHECENLTYLSDINLLFIEKINEFLGINTRISFSSDYSIEGDKTTKLLNICIMTNANEYLSGQSAKSYLNVESFLKAGINIKWMDYSGYKEYPQLFPPFVHQVSIIDLILNTGKQSTNYIKSFL